MSESRYLYVYILKCSDETYYTGITNSPERRIEEHNSGLNKNCYTFKRLPVEMLYCEMFTDFNLAIIWEKKIKDWSRKKKEALIKENWDQLKILAACKNYTSHKNLVDLNGAVLVPIAIGAARTDLVEELSSRTMSAEGDTAAFVLDSARTDTHHNDSSSNDDEFNCLDNKSNINNA